MSQTGSGSLGTDRALPSLEPRKRCHWNYTANRRNLDLQSPAKCHWIGAGNRWSIGFGNTTQDPKDVTVLALRISKRCHKRGPGIQQSNAVIQGPEIQPRCHCRRYPVHASTLGGFDKRCHDRWWGSRTIVWRPNWRTAKDVTDRDPRPDP